MLALVEGSKNLRRLCREYETESVTVHLKELVGGAFSLYAAATIRRTGGVHVFVAEDRDAAAYLLNDLYALLDERRILFFPSSYKRSIVYGAEDAQGVVQRTAALNALRTPPAGYLALCTYPEALAERVVDAEALRRETMTVRAGDHLRPADLVEWLDESGFVRVDFVYEPGQYSQRGGIVDVFSYVESLPYRFDFFDEEVDSIRRFNISSQLSQDKLQQAEIIPNLNACEGGRVSLVEAAGDVCYWFFDADYALRRVDDLRRRMLAEADDPAGVDRALTSRRQLLDALAGKRLFAARDTLAERPATVAVEFRTAPQPSFNKNFELLADDLSAATQKGYRTYILSENKAQVERLQNIFHQVGRGGVVCTPVSLTLHEGFVDHTLRLCCLYRPPALRPLPALPHQRRDPARRADDRRRAEPAQTGRLRGAYRSRSGAVRRSGQDQRERAHARGDQAGLPRRRRTLCQRPFAAPHFALQERRRRAAQGLQAGQRRLAEAQSGYQESRQGYFARADRALCQAQGIAGLRLLGRRVLAARARSLVPLRGDARPAGGHRGREARHGVGRTDGPARLRRRGLRQDGGGDPRRLQGRLRRQADRRTGSHDHSGVAALPFVHGAAARLSGENRIPEPYEIGQGDQRRFSPIWKRGGSIF